DRQTAVDVCKRLLSHLDANSTEQAADVLRIPVSEYLDPHRWQTEVDRIFRRVPLVVGLSCQLRQPGDYVTREVAGQPVVVIRGDDGTARTLLNVCRHRGAIVAKDECGHARRLACPYHAWTYDTTGALVGVPGRNSFGELDDSSLGLVSLPTQECHGLVFAVMTPGAGIDVDEWLGDIASEVADLHLDEMHQFRSLRLDGPNWKVAKDGYFDGYHFGALHKNTLGTIFLSNTQAIDTFGPHQRLCFGARSLVDLRDKPEDDWDVARDRFGMVLALFPSTAFAGGGTDGILVSQVYPGSHPMESVTYQTHLRRRLPTTPEEEKVAVANVEFLEYVVTQEDYATGLSINRALPSGANTEFVFGRNELGNQHFHGWVRRLVEAD
ncbi:MAG TPA: aromatic ring-hydroxylating dioxygenase subunit alpha, partial [Acidimicrobiales bacterium]